MIIPETWYGGRESRPQKFWFWTFFLKAQPQNVLFTQKCLMLAYTNNYTNTTSIL